MIRGTAAEFKFTLPCNFSELTLARVKFWQPGNDNANITKEKNHCYQGSLTNELCVKLLQNETRLFSETSKAYVQLRACCGDVQPFASHEQKFTVYPLHDTEDLGVSMDVPNDEGEVVLDAGEISEE